MQGQARRGRPERLTQPLCGYQRHGSPRATVLCQRLAGNSRPPHAAHRAATVTPQVQAEDILRGLVISLGRAAEQQGIREEEDLGLAIEDVQQRVYQERYSR